MLADYHTHTYYSDDSECPMEDMIKRAIAIGLDEIAFTEQQEIPHFYKWWDELQITRRSLDFYML